MMHMPAIVHFRFWDLEAQVRILRGLGTPCPHGKREGNIIWTAVTLGQRRFFFFGRIHTHTKLALLTVHSLKLGSSSRFTPPSRTSTPQDKTRALVKGKLRAVSPPGDPRCSRTAMAGQASGSQD